MVKKRTVVAIAATIFTLWIFVFILNQDSIRKVDEKEFFPGNNESNQENLPSTIDNPHNAPEAAQPIKGRSSRDVLDKIPVNAPKEDVFLDNGMWIPAGWTGLPLSLDNPTFVTQTEDVIFKKIELVNRLKAIPMLDWAREEKDQLWEEIMRKYETLIGWNGIFDALDQAQTELGIDVSRRLHVIGEVLAKSPLVTKNRFIVEITSREMLHKAPMHGGVWIITKDLLDHFEIFGDFSALFETIDEELCFFKNEDNMGNIWISCVHGVGHGIAKYYGAQKIEVAVDICSQHPDPQYQYACATGIFMELEKEYPEKTFAPCDSNRFAPACYRFKNRLTSHIFYDTKDPCSTQPTAYHRRACIWGFAYIKTNAKPSEVYSVCEPYRPQNPTEQPAANDYAACFDGFLGSHEIMNLPEKARANFCDPLLRYEKAHSICEYYCKNTLLRFTFGGSGEDEEEMFFYNYGLLEEIFDPSDLGKSATWLPEWDQIVPHVTIPKIPLPKLPQLPHAH